MAKVIDLRSDTVTQPSDAMRDAMAHALVGDDVYGEDPTVNRLEQHMADLLGKEQALFVPSGTMANQIAILSHTERGEEVLLHRDSHAYYYEGGAAALWAGATLTLLDGPEGLFSSETLISAIRPDNIHHPRARLLWIENTHNRAGGAALGSDLIDPLMAIAHQMGLSVHIDGARLFNAAQALHTPARRLVRDADSVSVCLSKGLGAPVGSLLVGKSELIERARRYRKWLGGGMRQAGILAAAGLIAIDNVERLTQDHDRASRLLEGLLELGFSARVPQIPTNMVMIDTPGPADAMVQAAKEQGLLFGTMGARTIRLVTHLNIDDEDVDHALSTFKRLRGSDFGYGE